MCCRALKKILFIIFMNLFIWEKIPETEARASTFVFEMEIVMACSSDSYKQESPCNNLKFTKINRTSKSLSFDLTLKRPFDEKTGGILELEKWTNEGWRKIPFIPMIPDSCNLFLKHYSTAWTEFMRALGVKHPDRCPIPAGNYSMKQYIFPSNMIKNFPFKGKFKMRALMVDLKTNDIITCLEMIGSQDILVE